MISYKKGDKVKVNPTPSHKGTIKDNLEYLQKYLSKKVTSHSILNVMRDSSVSDETLYVSFDGYEDYMFKDRFIKIEDVKLPEDLFKL